MKKTIALPVAALLLGFVTSFPVSAQDGKKYEWHIGARQGLMRVYAFNLGVLGAMAKGDMEYDAETASNAANNLQAAANMKNNLMWPPDSYAGGDGVAPTNAKREGWGEDSEVSDKQQAMSEAVATMAAEAGNGLDAVRANIGAVGNSCKGCHESYRISDD